MVSAESTNIDQETAIKWRFAEALLRQPNNPFKAAMQVTFGDTVAALSLMDVCLQSIEIAKMKAHLVEELGEEAFLPSESEMVRDVLDRAEASLDDDTYCRLMGLAFDVRGMTAKAKAGPSVLIQNNQTNNKIMNVPVMINAQGGQASDAEWEQGLIRQQEKLTAANG
jgi:hypothetical protein